MIRQTAVTLVMTLFVLLMAISAQCAVHLYNGRMEILTTSGKGCEGLAKSHEVSLTLTEKGGELSGYFIGGGITIGRFSGSDAARLEVRYPYHDELRATGHVVSLTRSDFTLVAELRDRHIEADVDDCNFDLARMELSRTVGGDGDAGLVQMAGLFDAQMTRSQAITLAQSDGYDKALPYFEKALVLADTYLAKGSDQINSYIIGLATSYIWLERFDEFNRLFDSRIVQIQDSSVRSLFSGYRLRTLMANGRKALGREEYDAALTNFEQAYKLQPQNREAIVAVMSVHVRSGRYTEALAFLEGAAAALENELDRKDIRAAVAMVLYKKAQKDDKDGRVTEAEDALKRAMEYDPGSVHYLIARARLLHKGGSLADAETVLENGLEQFKDRPSQNEIITARDKMRQTEMFLKKIRKAGS